MCQVNLSYADSAFINFSESYGPREYHLCHHKNQCLSLLILESLLPLSSFLLTFVISYLEYFIKNMLC